MHDFFFVVGIIVVWELARLTVTNWIKFYWDERKQEMLEECPMCFKKFPSIEYHRPRCSKRQQFTHFWSKQD